MCVTDSVTVVTRRTHRSHYALIVNKRSLGSAYLKQVRGRHHVQMDLVASPDIPCDVQYVRYFGSACSSGKSSH